MAVPTRSTAEQELDRWNQAMRQSPAYLNFMRSQGLPTNGRVSLSRQQQDGLERALAAAGMQIPGGMHVDQGGNLNQKNRLVRNTAIGAGVGAGALATAGALGAGPLAGVFGGGGGAAAGVSGVERAINKAQDAGSGVSLGRKALDALTSGKSIASLAAIIPALMMRPGGGGSGSGDPLSANPQINELIELQAQKARRADPLHAAVTQLAMNRLPTNVQR